MGVSSELPVGPGVGAAAPDPGRLTLDRIDPRGAERRIDLDPDDARARLETISDVENRLWLESRDKSVAVGSFLSPGERTEIHAVIRTGLVRRRLRQP